MIVMVAIYALCWLPLYCVTVIGDLQPTIWNFEGIQLVWIVCHWLAVSSCCWNPIVYYWTNDTLRAGFTYAVGTWCPCVSRPTAAAPTACRRQVVYRYIPLGSPLRGGSEVRLAASFVRNPSVRPPRRRCRPHGANSGRSDVELCLLRASPSAGRFVQSSPV